LYNTKKLGIIRYKLTKGIYYIMSAKLIYTPDNFTNLVNQTIDFNANQGLASYVVSVAMHAHNDSHIQTDAIELLQKIYNNPNGSAFDDFYHRYFMRAKNVFISKEIVDSSSWASVMYSILFNDGLILTAPAEYFLFEARDSRADSYSYQEFKTFLTNTLHNWDDSSRRSYHVSGDRAFNLVPSGEIHGDALAMFFAGVSWSLYQVRLDNLSRLAELSRNDSDDAPKVLLFQTDRHDFYLASAKYIEGDGYSDSYRLGYYSTNTFSVAGKPEIRFFDELYGGTLSVQSSDQLTYEGYAAYLTRENGQVRINVFHSRNYLRPFVQVQALTVAGEFFDYGQVNNDTHILLSDLGPRYTSSNIRDYSMPITDVPSEISLVKDSMTGTYIIRSYAIVVVDSDVQEEFVMNRRNDSDIESAGFYTCDCGSQSYVYDADDFAERLSYRASELYTFIEDNYNNPSEIYEGLLRYVRDSYDEEGPSDGYYCSECDMGEGDEEEDEYRQGYFSNISDSSIESIGTALATVNKKMLKTRLMHEDIYYVVDTDTDNVISAGDLDDYKVHDYDYDPHLEFVKKDEANPLYLGMEWEMDFGGKSHNKAILINSALSKNKRYSYTMSDGSLEEGIEIATMPATLAAHMSEFDYDTACKIASALNYRGHDTSTAGIHVHMSRSFFGKDRKIQNYKGALLALVLERNWDDFVKFSRRRYSRLDQWAKKKDYLDKLPVNPTPDDYESTFRQTYDYDKYVALNTRNSDTFELRIFRSTLKPETIKATLQLVHNFASWVKDNDLAASQQVSFEDIINYIPHKELNEYWQVAKEREVKD
jgi:hypothetical protein